MTPKVLSLHVGLCAIGLLAAACASVPRGGRAPCDIAASDSVFAAGRPVFRDCSVDRPARFISTGGMRPEFDPPARTACYSADLEFVVDAAGHPETSTARILRSNNQSFAQAVLETINAWTYAPAMRAGMAVRQIVTAHQMASTVIVRVPRGSSPPSGPPSDAPRC